MAKPGTINEKRKARWPVRGVGRGEEKSGRWWAADVTGDEVGRRVMDAVKILDEGHSRRHLQDALNIGLYEGEPPYWLAMASPRSPLLARPISWMDDLSRARSNVIKSVVDTAAAMIAKNLAEVRVDTNGGSWKLMRRARNMAKFVNGALRQMGFHAEQQRAFVDGCLARSGGLVKFIANYAQSRIECERTHPSTIIWNAREGAKPRTLYQRVAKSKSELLDLYVEKDEKIAIEGCSLAQRVSRPAYEPDGGSDVLAEMIDVVEAWRLPGAQSPGRHVIAIESGVLLDEEWDLECFPFARFAWDDADKGWACKPLADNLRGYQLQIGRTMRKIDRNQSLACVSRVGVEEGSEILDDEMTNEAGGIFHYRGTPPVFVTPQALSAEVYRYLDWIYDKAFAEAGISMLQAQGEKPAGINAGVAIREYNDITSTRQVPKGQRWERMVEQAAYITLKLGAKIAEHDPSYEVTALGNRSFERMRFKDVAMDLKDIRLRCNPVSALPSHTVGKIQTITDMIKGGLLPPEEVQNGLALKLLNFPDLEKVVTLESVNQELAEMQVDEALYEGRYVAPEPYQSARGLQTLKTLAARQYMHAQMLDDVPERNVDYLRRLMSEADELQQRIAGKAPVIQQPSAAVAPPAPVPLQPAELAPPMPNVPSATTAPGTTMAPEM